MIHVPWQSLTRLCVSVFNYAAQKFVFNYTNYNYHGEKKSDKYNNA